MQNMKANRIAYTKLLDITLYIIQYSAISLGLGLAYYLRFISRNENFESYLGFSIPIFIFVISLVWFFLLNVSSRLTLHKLSRGLLYESIFFLKRSIYFSIFLGFISYVTKAEYSRVFLTFSVISSFLFYAFMVSVCQSFVNRSMKIRFHGLILAESKSSISSIMEWLEKFGSRIFFLPKFLKTSRIDFSWFEEFEHIRKLTPVDYVILTPQLLSDSRSTQFVNYLRELDILVFLIPIKTFVSGYWLNPVKAEGIPFLTFESREIPFWRLFLKRLMDFSLAIIILILLLPLFLGISLAICIRDGRPIFYVSQRVGFRGVSFRMYKFRTMVQSRETSEFLLKNKHLNSNFIFKDTHDPRVTELGKTLRKYSLDELPQLLNVLRGEMSIVGPRPFPPYEVNRFDSLYLGRLRCKPGLTGPWQIGGRSNLDLSISAELDLEYAHNWTLSRDILIILKTIPAVLRKTGAY